MVAIGQKMEMVFSVMRLCVFHDDWVALEKQIAKLKASAWSNFGGADWERKNRLKVYEGVYKMARRDFVAPLLLFLESLSIFTTYELMTTTSSSFTQSRARRVAVLLYLKKA